MYSFFQIYYNRFLFFFNSFSVVFLIIFFNQFYEYFLFFKDFWKTLYIFNKYLFFYVIKKNQSMRFEKYVILSHQKMVCY